MQRSELRYYHDIPTVLNSRTAEKAFCSVLDKLPGEVHSILRYRLSLVTNSVKFLPLEAQQKLQVGRTLDGLAFGDAFSVHVYYCTRGATLQYAQYVLAHELAHVYLGHLDGIEETDDKELQADQMASQWGFSYRL